MKLIRWFYILLIATMSTSVWAEEYRRSISLEWEPIEDAILYDVEITPLVQAKPQKPKVHLSNKAEWNGKLDFGDYLLRVRGRDRRKVPGEWSESQQFAVVLEAVKAISPAANEKVLTNSEDTEKVSLKWKPVGGADEYIVEVYSEDGKFKETEKTYSTNITFKLPVANKYSWKVTATNTKGLSSEAVSIEQFSFWGGKLNKPVVNEPASAFVRELEWQRPTWAESFDYALTRYNEQTKKWEVKERVSKITDSKIPFKESLPGGKYKIAVRANGNLRQSSNISELSFPVVNGNRSPAAEETATVRQSIDRTTGWFVVASYLLTTINYEGSDADNGTSTAIDGALGGTGRLGMGYLSDKSNWGFLGIVDYSGFLINSQVYNYGSMEGNAVYRMSFGDRSELRHQFGMFYKELPVFIGNSIASAQGNLLVTMGPHYALEYWQAVSPKFGFQLNMHMYMNMMAVKTPNGGEMIPELSMQYGFLGSYRLSRKMTGLAGYAYRKDLSGYKANNGSKNASSVTGNYVNLFLEWAL